MTIDQRIIDAFQETQGFSLLPSLVLMATIGSDSHGTKVITGDAALDDTDFMGIILPPPAKVLGLHQWDNWHWQHEELDVVCYSLPKAIKMLSKNNPNIMNLLWLREQDYVYQTEVGKSLIANREMFSSKEAYYSFVGYAHGQLKRMTAFDANRMDEYEFLTKYIEEEIDGTVEDVLRADDNKLMHLAGKDIAVKARLQSFRSLHRNYYSGYMGKKRKALVREFGYDAKNGQHLIRLLRLGKEFMETGVLNVYRSKDADELKDIKQGKWTLAQVQAEADALFKAAEVAHSRSTLPEKPDETKIDTWLVEHILEDYRLRRGHGNI